MSLRWGKGNEEDEVIFQDGEYLCGILDKKQLGPTAGGSKIIDTTTEAPQVQDASEESSKDTDELASSAVSHCSPDGSRSCSEVCDLGPGSW
jgi:hypothetical protein